MTMIKKIAVAAAVLAASSAALASAAEIHTAVGGTSIPGSYIVVLKPGTTVAPGGTQAGLTLSQVSVDFAARYGGTVTHMYGHALEGFAVRLSEAAAQKLAQ